MPISSEIKTKLGLEPICLITPCSRAAWAFWYSAGRAAGVVLGLSKLAWRALSAARRALNKI